MAVMEEARPGDPAMVPAPAPRFGGMKPHEWWGYAVWGFVGAIIAAAELAAAFGSPWWLTISATVGHLEMSWNPLRIIVVALIAAGAVQLLTYPPRQTQYLTRPGRSPRWRTSKGRLTRAKTGQDQPLPLAKAYFPAAVVAVVAAAAAAAALGGSKFVVGYALYGTIAVTLVIVPNVLAFCWAREVPFPTLVRTLDDLDRRLHSVVMIVVAGLAVLAIHLVAYPWP